MTSTVTTDVEASAAEVFDVLADGWTYAAWVVGASRVRDVDAAWPQPGSCIHHSIGAWPVLVHDRTKVLEADEPHTLELDVAVWFLGRGRVRFEIEPLTSSTCRVTMHEKMVKGLMSVPPEAAVDPLLGARNRETLRRLGALAAGRAA
ncbi:SRPBCC family protein [Angustibacter peucedani]